MKILLDENLPHRMRLEIVGHEVFTVAYIGWSGIANGELLQRAVAEGFEVFITNDRGLEYEHNLLSLPVSIVVVCPPTNTIEAIRPLLPALHAALAHLQPQSFVKIPSP
jgi:hypothetical protein